jgi:hypothetical protein
VIVTRGSHRGEQVTLHQFANDWLTVEEFTAILGPSQVAVTATELARMREEGAGAGMFWRLWDVVPTDSGTFTFRRKATT